MKLYTRTGDDGGTVLFDGTRVLKDDPRVAAYGAVDELNAHLGIVAALLSRPGAPAAAIRERILHIQNTLFAIGADLATPEDSARRAAITPLSEEAATQLEPWIDEAVAPTPPLRVFVLPGGSEVAAALHVCRTVCRRAERRVVTSMQHTRLNSAVVVYLNRLSDLLFAWARWANHVERVEDVKWEP